jgi:hypothetical protein
MQKTVPLKIDWIPKRSYRLDDAEKTIIESFVSKVSKGFEETIEAMRYLSGIYMSPVTIDLVNIGNFIGKHNHKIFVTLKFDLRPKNKVVITIVGYTKLLDSSWNDKHTGLASVAFGTIELSLLKQ